MQNVKFLSGYQGVKTGEVWFDKGSFVELQNDPAFELVEMGVVEIVIPKAKAEAVKESDDLESLTVKDLKAKAKEFGLSGYSKFKKDELIAALQEIELTPGG